MVYISEGGSVLQSQSPWRLSIIPELFWGFVNFIVLFFKTMINPNMSKRGKQHTSDYRRPGSGPPGPPRRRHGGFGGNDGGPSAPPPPVGG